MSWTGYGQGAGTDPAAATPGAPVGNLVERTTVLPNGTVVQETFAQPGSTLAQGQQQAATGATTGPSGWIAIAIIVGGIAAVGYGVIAAFQAGGRAKEAASIGDRILEKYGQKDQSAALRTCVRLAIRGQDCEGGSLDGSGILPKKGSRAERCGYSESKCMSSADLQAFSQCMRGDDL